MATKYRIMVRTPNTTRWLRWNRTKGNPNGAVVEGREYAQKRVKELKSNWKKDEFKAKKVN